MGFSYVDIEVGVVVRVGVDVQFMMGEVAVETTPKRKIIFSKEKKYSLHLTFKQSLINHTEAHIAHVEENWPAYETPRVTKMTLL